MFLRILPANFMTNIKAWIVSFRLRTLPLALSTIFMGSVLAAEKSFFNANVLLWAALTTLFLQILSNLANDYGDAISGADNAERVGPQRMIQSGVISLAQMKLAMYICGVFAFASGLMLLWISFEGILLQGIFLLLGLTAIAAAVKYTVGSSPYGYRGLGDVYVFIFFGLLGVAGTFFLHSNIWSWGVLLPASTIGLFSAGVLNLNNLRDIESDRNSNKITLVVRMGAKAAVWYHLGLVAGGWVLMATYILLFSEWQIFWPVLLSLPLFARNVLVVFRHNQPSQLDGELRNLALSTLIFVVLSAVSVMFL